MKIELTKDVRRRMLECLAKEKRREVGGILMAEQVKPGEFRIVDFSLDNITGSSAHFVRSPEYHRAALEAFFARTGHDYARFNYLGEWHSHPSHPLRPSEKDISSMKDLLAEEQSIPFAVLLIVKRGWWRRLSCSATFFNQGDAPSIIQVGTEE